MKAKDLRKISEKELQKMLGEEREKLLKLRFDLAAGKLKNVREIRERKKNIAKILTILNEKNAQKKITR